MADTKHLKKRGSNWFVRLKVPAHLRARLGPEVVRTTGTGDLREARERSYRIIADIKQTFREAERAERAGPVDPRDPASVLTAVRQALLSGDPEMAQQVAHEAIDAYLATRKGPLDADGYPPVPADAVTTIRAATSMVYGEHVELLGVSIETYLGELESSAAVTQQTLRIKRRHLERFRDHLGELPTREVTKTHARRFLEEVLLPSGKSAKTTKDAIGHLSAFGTWCVDRERMNLNPFSNLGRSIRESKRGNGNGKKRTPWSEDELLTMLSSLDAHDTTAVYRRGGRLLKTPGITTFAMVAIAAYSGMRENEIGSLELADVYEDRVYIREGKTESSVRYVPLHDAIRPLVAHLVALAKERDDTYLIPHLTPGGPDNRRAYSFPKTFRRAKDAAGITREGAVFHALRNTAVTAMKRAGVPAEMRKEIVGHKGVEEVHDLYSDRADFEALKGAINRITYGDAVDTRVRTAVSS